MCLPFETHIHPSLTIHFNEMKLVLKIKHSDLWVKVIEHFREIGLYGDHHLSTLITEHKCSGYKFGKCTVTTEIQIIVQTMLKFCF